LKTISCNILVANSHTSRQHIAKLQKDDKKSDAADTLKASVKSGSQSVPSTPGSAKKRTAKTKNEDDTPRKKRSTNAKKAIPKDDAESDTKNDGNSK
jgi:ATP-dependent Clp protease ATP-binding subunit ClpA